MLSAIVDFALQSDISVEHTYTCTYTNVCMYLLLSTVLELDHDILSSLTFLGHVKGKSRVLALIPFVFALVQTLVFSQFTMMLDILEDYLDLRGIRYGRLDGAMAFTERERQVRM